jgi:hypothetical protein
VLPNHRLIYKQLQVPALGQNQLAGKQWLGSWFGVVDKVAALQPEEVAAVITNKRYQFHI